MLLLNSRLLIGREIFMREFTENAIVDQSSGPRQAMWVKITGNMHIDGVQTVLGVNRIFWDRDPYFARFGTSPHTYSVLNSEIRIFYHNFLLNLPRFCSIVRYTSIAMYHIFTQYTPHFQEKEHQIECSCTIFSAWRIHRYMIQVTLPKFHIFWPYQPAT